MTESAGSRKPKRSSTTEPDGRKVGKAKALAELETENRALKRKVARLEKRLLRYQDADYEEPEEVAAVPAPVPAILQQCKECLGEDFIELKTPNKLLICCKRCKTRIEEPRV